MSKDVSEGRDRRRTSAGAEVRGVARSCRRRAPGARAIGMSTRRELGSGDPGQRADRLLQRRNGEGTATRVKVGGTRGEPAEASPGDALEHRRCEGQAAFVPALGVGRGPCRAGGGEVRDRDVAVGCPDRIHAPQPLNRLKSPDQRTGRHRPRRRRGTRSGSALPVAPIRANVEPSALTTSGPYRRTGEAPLRLTSKTGPGQASRLRTNETRRSPPGPRPGRYDRPAVRRPGPIGPTATSAGPPRSNAARRAPGSSSPPSGCGDASIPRSEDRERRSRDSGR